MERLSIKLTAAQRREIAKIVGRDAEAIELSVEELEERIAPSRLLRDPVDLNLVDGASDGLDVDGVPDLAAGEPIGLDGLGDAFDGDMSVDGTDHAIGDGGYRTSFDADRSD